MSHELALLADNFGFNWDDIVWLAVNAVKSAFIPFDKTRRLTQD
jgi:adenosine deaminase